MTMRTAGSPVTGAGADECAIALVGIGGYGQFYVRELLGAAPERRIRLAAAIDPLAEYSPAYAVLQQEGVPIYADLESFFARQRADLVVISAPIHYHAAYTCAALAYGAYVLCEKPLCATLDEARQMAEAQRQSGRWVAVGYQWSFANAIQALKRDVLAGVLGRPRRARSMVLWPRPSAYYQRNNWAGRIRLDSGAWVYDSPAHNATAHYLHNMLYLLGESPSTSAVPATVQAELYRANPIENYDAAALRVATVGGAEILFYTAHSVPVESGPRFSLECDLAVVEYDAQADGHFVARFHDGRQRDYGNPQADDANKIWQSVEALRTGAPVACGIEAALPQVQCIHGAQASVDEIVTIPPEWTRQEAWSETNHLTWVEGLPAYFERGYAQYALPIETGAQPWSRVGRAAPINNGGAPAPKG